MDDEYDDPSEDNPAVSALMPALTPSAVMEAMDDPTVFEPLSRGILYEQLVLMRQLAQNPAMPMSQRLEFSKFAARMGKVDNPDKNQILPMERLPTITMIFPNAGRNVEIGARPVIDVTPDGNAD